MEITEKDLEDLIFDSLTGNPQSLKETGFKITLIDLIFPNRIHWSRQVDLKGYGRADIIGYTRAKGQIFVDIIELKNVPITSKDFDQAGRYRQAVIEMLRNSLRGYYYPAISTYLVGPSIESGHYIHNLSQCGVITFQYGLKGFQFNKHAGKWQNGDGDMRLCDASSKHTFSVVYGK